MRFLCCFISQKIKLEGIHSDAYSYMYKRASISERELFLILKSTNFKILFRLSFEGFLKDPEVCAKTNQEELFSP